MARAENGGAQHQHTDNAGHQNNGGVKRGDVKGILKRRSHGIADNLADAPLREIPISTGV